jgi:hypothetical protein
VADQLQSKEKGEWYLSPEKDKFQMGTTFQKISKRIYQSLKILKWY